MNDVLTPAQVFYRTLVDEPETAATVAKYLSYADRDTAELEFAEELYEYMKGRLSISPNGHEGPLLACCVMLVIERTNWRTLARKLLNHFQVPIKLSQIVDGSSS